MNILAISGSLRSLSVNSAFCRAAAQLAPPAIQVSVFTGLGRIPPFNPDLEEVSPPAVQSFRASIRSADALLVASPEYAHGVSGVLKNALDWLVSFEGTVYKPVALINTSPRAHLAYESLREILRTMSLDIIADASVAIPLMGVCNTQAEMTDSPKVRAAIQGILDAMVAHLTRDETTGPSSP